MHAFVRPGRFVVCEATAHVGGTEAASAATLSGIAFRRIPARARGLLSADQVAAALEPDPYDVDQVDLVAIENTHQVGGGSVLPVGGLAAIAKVCAGRGTPLYLDGARIFNACAVTGTTRGRVRRARGRDDVLPVQGPRRADRVVAGRGRRVHPGGPPAEDPVRRGAWRQAGMMAAAGLIALRDGPGRLAEDHANARRLAEGIAGIVPGGVDPAAVVTNIVFVDVSRSGHSPREWEQRLAEHRVRVTLVAGRVRMLTHADVTARDIETALAAWRRVAAELIP